MTLLFKNIVDLAANFPKVYCSVNKFNFTPKEVALYFGDTVMPTKSDSDVILCLQLLTKITRSLCLIQRASIDHLCVNPIQRIGLIHK